MKRASVEEGAKHQYLLQDFLELQKEFVSKKKKLQAAEQKRDTLLAEVRFLKQRRKFLLKVRSSKIKQGNSKNSDTKRKVLEREIKESANEATLRNQYPVLISNSNLIVEEENGGKEEEVRKEVGIRKNKSCLIDNKTVGKKKISWQDPVTLKV